MVPPFLNSAFSVESRLERSTPSSSASSGVSAVSYFNSTTSSVVLMI
jgi:hypothetical protein